MTQRISIELFSHLAVTVGEEQIQRFRTQKTAVLLAYLALFSHRSHPREELIEMLWPDGDMEAGRTSLRTALASLRRQIEPPGVDANSLLVADRAKVQLNPALLHTDVAAFEAGLQRARRAETPAQRAQELKQAIGLYRGPLLPGFYEEWALNERTRLEQRLCGGWRDLVQACAQSGDLPGALEAAQRLAAAAPLEELSHLMAMRLYAALGQQAGVKRQFETWTQIADRELGETPSPQARALYRQMLESSPAAVLSGLSAPTAAPSQTAAPSSHPAPPAAVSAPTDTAGEPGGASPAAPRAAHLPVSLTRFFGRESELAQITELLQSGQTRLLTLTGPGGTGKTRLGLEAARSLVDTYAQAVWFVPLADVTETAQAGDAIAHALSLRPSADTPLLDEIAAFFGSRSALLVLDNFEQLPADAAEIVQHLLMSAQALTCLITSRLPLQIGGEQEYPIAPLPIPALPDDTTADNSGQAAVVPFPAAASFFAAPGPNSQVTLPPTVHGANAASLTPAALTVFPSVQLFVDRARQARPDFQITVHNAPHIAALCARLEGIPLALELTAAWAQMLSPAQMLQRLERRFDLVASRRKDLPARHRTLRAAIEWSFRLLPPALQTFFARLAVFHGGWTIEAAEAVCEEPDAFDYLTQLRQHSLILVDEDDSPYTDVRFRMLETLREYAQEQITPEQRVQAQSRHLQYYATLAQTASRHLLGPEQTAWLYRLSRDNDNIRAAFGAAQASPENQQYALRLASSLWRFWEIRGYYSEGRARCEAVLALPAVHAPSVERAMVCNGAGNLAYHQGDNETARLQWEDSLAIMQTLNHKRGMSIALGNLGNLASDLGDYARARALYTQSLDIKREIGGDPASQAITLSNLGNVHVRENDFEGARDLYRQALRLHENAGNVGGKLIALVSLAAAANMQAQHEEARVSYYDALLLCRQLGERLWSALSLEGMARIAAAQNRDATAVRLYAAAAALRDAIDTPIDPEDKEARDADLDILRRRMDRAEYAENIQQGRALSWEQALSDALLTMQDTPDSVLPADALEARLL